MFPFCDSQKNELKNVNLKNFFLQKVNMDFELEQSVLPSQLNAPPPRDAF